MGGGIGMLGILTTPPPDADTGPPLLSLPLTFTVKFSVPPPVVSKLFIGVQNDVGAADAMPLTDSVLGPAAPTGKTNVSRVQS